MAIKKLLLGLIPVALLGGCAVMGASCSVTLEAQGVHLARKNLEPQNYNPAITYPTQVDLLSDYVNMPNWVYGSTITLSTDQDCPLFDLNYSYVAVRAYGEWNDDDFTLTAVDFARFTGLWYQSFNFDVPYAFDLFTPSTGVYYLYQNKPAITGLDKFAVQGTSYYPVGDTYTANRSASVLVRQTLSTTNSGPYYAYFDENATIANLESMLVSHFTTSAQDYSRGYNVGLGDGRAQADQQKYNEGYQAGLSDAGESAPMVALFSAIVGVPISVLNGLTPLAVWNIPLISILISFVFFGLILWIVRKFFAR